MFQLIPMLNIVGFFFVKFYNTWLLIFMPHIFKHNILEFFFLKFYHTWCIMSQLIFMLNILGVLKFYN